MQHNADIHGLCIILLHTEVCNSFSQAAYLSVYLGTERGVLVQLGQKQLLGHFPLGLWDEEQRNSHPEI